MNRRSIISIIIAALTALAIIIPLSGLTASAGARTAGPAGIEGDGEHYLGRQPVSPERARLLRESTPKAPPPRLEGRSLPSSVNLSGELPPVGDQGSQGSCVDWACVYYQKTHSETKFEHTSWDLTNPWYQFSPSFIYNQGGGDLPQYAYPLLETKGCVDIAEMPYYDWDDTTQPTAAQLEAAKPYKIQDNWAALWNHLGDSPPYPQPNPIIDAKSWLADGYVLSSGICVDSGFPDYGGSDPATYYDPNSGGIANHQVAICGYDDNINPSGEDPDHQGGFLMVNSWGSGWNGGMNGYLWLSYDWVKYYVEDCWVIHNVSPDTPSITGCSSYNGNVGDPITINGYNFGTSRRSSGVTFNGVTASTTSFTNSSVTATVPAGATSGPLAVYDWEGTSSNKVNFYVEETPPAPHISGLSKTSGHPGEVLTIFGTGFGFVQGASTASFNGTNASTINHWSDSQIDAVIPKDATTGDVLVTTDGGTSNGKAFTVEDRSTWYLAEGSTGWGYETYISIMNPNSEAVSASVTYMTDTGAVPGGDIDLPALSQATVNPVSLLGEKDFSTKVECKEGKQIAVDRTVSWTGEGAPSPDGHCSIGVTSPARTWYLPEGSSDWGFECWLLIQNPNGQEATCQVTYMTESEGPKSFEKKVPASSRKSYNMANDIGNMDASIKVESDIPVIPERAMYRNNRREGHDSIGTTAPALSYYLAEGTTAWGFTTYVLIQNPADSDTEVTITYMTGEGPVPQAPFTMSANSRKTIRVNDMLPDRDFSIRVTGSAPIIAERAIYWGEGTEMGEACHDSIGMSSPHTTFYLPDGESSNGRETFTLVQNSNTEAVTVEIVYLTPTGQGNVTRTETVPAQSRKTYEMLAHSGITGRASILINCITPGKKIMCERAIYWNSRGAGTDTIGGYSD